MSLLKILIIALLILFPFGEILRFDLGNNIFLKPLDAVSVLLFFWTAVLFIRNKSFRPTLKWYYFLFPLIGLVSLVSNSYWLKPNEFVTSFIYLLRWVSYLSIFFAVGRVDASFKKKIVSFLVVDGLVILFIGYIQYFFYPSLRNLFYLGWDEHLYRMFSSFLDPNFVGAFFVLYLLFVLSLFFQERKEKNPKMQLVYGFLALVTLIATFLTYSRSALLMLVISGITFFLLLQKRKFIFLLLGALVLFVLIISPFFYIENLDLFRVNSSIARLNTSQHALSIIQDHPLIGVGFDSYRYAQQRYHFTAEISQFPAHSAAGVDMSLLFVFATTGIVGLFSYLYLWLQLIKNAKANYIQNKFAVIFLASAAGLFVNSLFLNSLFYPEIMLWMWVIAGLINEK